MNGTLQCWVKITLQLVLGSRSDVVAFSCIIRALGAPRGLRSYHFHPLCDWDAVSGRELPLYVCDLF